MYIDIVLLLWHHILVEPQTIRSIVNTKKNEKGICVGELRNVCDFLIDWNDPGEVRNCIFFLLQ